jgi:head-tail adaptor
VATVRASLLPVSSSVNAEHQTAKVSTITYEVGINFRTGIDASMAIAWGSKSLEITSPPIDPDGRKRWLTFTAEETIDHELQARA